MDQENQRVLTLRNHAHMYLTYFEGSCETQMDDHLKFKEDKKTKDLLVAGAGYQHIIWIP